MKISILNIGVILLGISAANAADLDWNGKFRYRHQRSHLENDAGRTRDRLQAKLGVKAKISDDFKVALGLASGSTGATSTNQTLKSSDSRSFSLDYAQFKFTCPLTGAVVSGGKLKSPFYRPGKTQVIWDGDVNPEGLYAAHTKSFGAFGYDLLVGNIFISEDKGAAKDNTMLAAQLAFTFKMDNMNFRLGASRYNYESLQGGSLVSTSNNTNTTSGTFDYNYRIQEIYLVAGTKIMDMPLELYLDMISNKAISKNNDAKTFGVSLGKASKKGKFKVSYNFREIEKDAVVASLVDVDPNNGNGTDWKGHTFSAKYALADNATLGFTYQMAEDNLTPAAGASVKSNDWTLSQLDLVLKF